MPFANGSWNGTRPTAEELSQVLEQHQRWLATGGGQQANLCGANLSGCDLRGCNLRRADLRDCDLSGANLSGCDLRRADLENVPIVTSLHRRTLAAIGDHPERFDMRAYHTCETTHCRAGFAIKLAGQRGAELEEKLGPSVAAALIIAASCPYLDRVPDFYATDEDALADIRRCAELEPELVEA